MSNKYFPFKLLFWVTLFAVAMGFLETSVVVYLRALLYPGGFEFPLKPIPENLALTELLREAATIIMLMGIGYMAGKTFTSRFAWFLYAFAIWDIFYYIFLKLLLNWPETWLTWDILFLIPTTWVGPVIAPVIVSISMIFLAILIIRVHAKKNTVTIQISEWSLLILGSLVLITSFTWEYSGFILKHYSFSQLWTIPTDELLKISQNYIPHKFNWLLFCLGQIIILLGIGAFYRRNRKI